MAWIRRLKQLLLPPSGPLLAALGGLLLHAAGLERPGIALAAAGLLALYLLSAPWCARPLLESLDRFPVLDPQSPGARTAGAIVILDAGRRSLPPERGGDAVSLFTLERLAAGAALHRRLGLPVLVSGAGARELMAEVLEDSFAVPVRWVERDSRNTHENAARSARLLNAAGVGGVVLLTHFWHMPRAAAAFRRTGLEVTPAPIGFTGRLRTESGLMALVPSTQALSASYLALHEWLGMVWYRLRYRPESGTSDSSDASEQSDTRPGS